jgi:hypothetical protein
MSSHTPLVLGLVVAVCAPVAGQPPAKAKVEFRWLESKKIDGVTEDKGFQTTCDPKSIAYPHKKAALTLTAAEVADVRLTAQTFGATTQYMIDITLTKAARDKLAAQCDDGEWSLTTLVDGKYWGTHRYAKVRDKLGVPEQARAESFAPTLGFFTSKAEAERVVDALK